MKIKKYKVAELSHDPANARKHNERNIQAIMGSLRRFGQQKPIVVDSSGVVRAGNGTLEAARILGWEEIDGVETGLQGTEATAYAIADNRTAELAEWDDDVLAATLQGLVTDDEDLLEAVGFDEDELAKLLPEESEADKENQKALPQSLQLKPGLEYCVVVCGSAEEWLEMQETFKLQQVRRGGYKKGSQFDAISIERVLRFTDLMERITDADSGSLKG